MRLAKLILIVITTSTATTQTPRKPIRLHASCALNNHPVDVVNAKTGQVEERDNYSGSCTVKRDDVVVYETRLTLPEYATIHDATVAAEEFIKKTVPKLQKEHKW